MRSTTPTIRTRSLSRLLRTSDTSGGGGRLGLAVLHHLSWYGEVSGSSLAKYKIRSLSAAIPGALVLKEKFPSLEHARATMDSIIAAPMIKSFLAGSFSGTCSTILFQPLDLVKTRLQSPLAIGSKSHAGMLKTLVTVIRNEKVAGLWKGVTPSIWRCVPGVGMYFCTLHELKAFFFSENDPTAAQSLLLGATARSIVGVSMLPVTVVKVRYECGMFQYRGVVAALKDLYRQEGRKGLYSGLSATLLRDVPFSGIYFMCYSELKKRIPSDQLDSSFVPVLHFTCGIVAGAMASAITQPADVIKTQMQIHPYKHKWMGSAAITVYEINGLKGFFRGIVPRTVRRTLMAAMAWTVYEQIMKRLGLK
ncbi:SLC25A38 [Branchiostoma lanceolatum]|uniref:Mitochondrial glycine transporter n=2 Tax=Branchiostoma lanceolatum TaxID=7740 RepID=A0A8K0AF59_BRALA|nr:SLC25A38 [Branchiostoma lanceolatum]